MQVPPAMAAQSDSQPLVRSPSVLNLLVLQVTSVHVEALEHDVHVPSATEIEEQSKSDSQPLNAFSSLSNFPLVQVDNVLHVVGVLHPVHVAKATEIAAQLYVQMTPSCEFVVAAQLVAEASHGENGFGEVEQVTSFEGVPVMASVCEDGFELIIVREVALEAT